MTGYVNTAWVSWGCGGAIYAAHDKIAKTLAAGFNACGPQDAHCVCDRAQGQYGTVIIMPKPSLLGVMRPRSDATAPQNCWLSTLQLPLVGVVLVGVVCPAVSDIGVNPGGQHTAIV